MSPRRASPPGSTVLGKTIGDLLGMAHGEALITSILRSKSLRLTPLPDVVLKEGDILMIEGSHEALDRLAAQAKFSLTDDRESGDGQAGDIEAIEAVIAENSPLIGWSAQRLALYDRFKVNLLAVSRQGERQTERLGQITLKLGDVIVLQGNRVSLPETLREIGCLPLAERPILLGSVRRGIVPLFILIAAMGSTAVGLLPVEIAFFAAAVAMVLFRVIPSRQVYSAMDGSILVMLATLIPVSDSLRQTGATDVIATWLSSAAAALAALWRAGVDPGCGDGRSRRS